MSPLLTKIFRKLLASDEVTSKKIANEIKREILNHSLPLGSLLPSKNEVTKFLGVSKAMVDDAWSLLEKKLRLIVTHPGGHWYVVLKLPSGQDQSALSDYLTRQHSHGRYILFNQDYVSDSDPLMKGLKNSFKKCVGLNDHLTSEQRKVQLNPLLVTQMRSKVNHSIVRNYRQDELVYCRNHKSSIYNISSVLLSSKAVFVMGVNAPQTVVNAVLEAGKKIERIRSDEDGLIITELEKLCAEKNVGIVYVSSRSNYPIHHRLSDSRMRELRALQEEYKFIIIEDDRYAACFDDEASLFMDSVAVKKNNVIYIRPLSAVSEEMNNIVIIAGPVKLISRLTTKLIHTGCLFSAEKARGLSLFMQKNELRKYEYKLNVEVEKIRKITIKMLKNAGAWKLEGVFYGRGWLFYLEPSSGELPVDIYESLIKEGIFVINPADYLRFPQLSNGVFISVLNYVSDSRLSTDLKKLTDFLALNLNHTETIKMSN